MKHIDVTMGVLKTVTEFTSVEIPTQQVLILLALANSSEPIAMQSLQAHSGVTQASVSRNCSALGPGPRPGVPGYGLIEAYEDPEWRRRKLVRFTQKGELLRKRLKELG